MIKVLLIDALRQSFIQGIMAGPNGNFYKWLNGHNVTGCENLIDLVLQTIEKLKNLNLVDPTKEQLETIVRDLANEQIYKPSFYTKFFYIDNNDNMRKWVIDSESRCLYWFDCIRIISKINIMIRP